MKKPYKMALYVPLPFSFFLVKKLTVNGIIGNTHGVKRASNPPIRPKRKILIIDLSLFVITVSFSILQLASCCIICSGSRP